MSDFEFGCKMGKKMHLAKLRNFYTKIAENCLLLRFNFNVKNIYAHDPFVPHTILCLASSMDGKYVKDDLLFHECGPQ